MLRDAQITVDPDETRAWDTTLVDLISLAAELPLANDSPTRGDLWLIRLPRAVGAELQRDRPVVVISSPALDEAPIRIIVPLTTWRAEFVGRFNKLRIAANEGNGLNAESAADFLQVRSVSTERFLRRIGALEADQVEEIVAGVVIAIDYRS